MKYYDVSFTIELENDYTEWIKEALISGLNKNDVIYNFDIYELQSHDLEVH